MAKNFKQAAALTFIATVVAAVLYRISSLEVILTLAIIFGTTAYHLIMRLMVGFIFDLAMRNKADFRRRRYHVGKREMALYEKLNVKRLSRKMPTYNPSLFDTNQHTWEDIVQAMCQAELIHETIAALSFLPIFAGIWFGAYPVFIITSILPAAFDMVFVMMQRYNRQRIITMIDRKQKLQLNKNTNATHIN